MLDQDKLVKLANAYNEAFRKNKAALELLNESETRLSDSKRALAQAKESLESYLNSTR